MRLAPPPPETDGYVNGDRDQSEFNQTSKHFLPTHRTGNCLLQSQSGTTVSLNDLSLQLTTGGQFSNQEITGINNGIVASGANVTFTFAQPTRLYADPSTPVTLAESSGSGPGPCCGRDHIS